LLVKTWNEIFNERGNSSFEEADHICEASFIRFLGFSFKFLEIKVLESGSMGREVVKEGGIVDFAKPIEELFENSNGIVSGI